LALTATNPYSQRAITRPQLPNITLWAQSTLPTKASLGVFTVCTHKPVSPSLVKTPAGCVHINQLGVIQKGHAPDKWHLITGLPSQCSDNDGINLAFCSMSVSLDSVAAAATARSANGEIARYARGVNRKRLLAYWKFSIMLVKWSGHGSRSSSG